METLLKIIARFVAVRHKAVMAVFAAATVASLFTVSRMEIKADIIDVLPEGNARVKQFKDFVGSFGALETVTVVIQARDGKVDRYIPLLEALAERLQASPFIEYLDYSPVAARNDFFVRRFPLFLDARGMQQLGQRLTPDGIDRRIRLNRERLLSPVSTPMDSELALKDPLGIGEIVIDSLKRSNRDDLLDLSAGYYVTKDHSVALLFAKPKGRSRDMAFVRDLKRELDGITAAALADAGSPRGAEIAYTGAHILSEEARAAIRHDVVSSTLISILVIGLLIRLAYRVRASVLAGIGFTMLASLSMTLAFAYYTFGSLNIVTSIVAAVLIGLYVDYTMNMVKRFGDELQEGGDRVRALEVVVTKTGTAITASAVTTALSFFSIIITRFEGLYELGIVAGMGVLFCLVSSLLLMSSILFYISEGGSGKVFLRRDISSGVEGLISLVTRRARLVLAAGAILIALAGAGLTGLRFDNDPEHMGVGGSKAMAALRLVNDKLGKSSDPMHIVVRGDNADELTAAFDILEKDLAQWKSQGLINRYDSLGLLLPPPAAQQRTLEHLHGIRQSAALTGKALESRVIRALESNELSYDRTTVASYLAGITTSLAHGGVAGIGELAASGNNRAGHFVSADGRALAAHIYPSGMGWDRQAVEKIEQVIAGRGEKWTVTGKTVLFKEIKSTVILGSALATLLTLVLNVAVIWWFYRRARYVVLALLPVMLGFLITPGLMGWLGASLNFINIGTLALIFGLGVDYGIYVMHAFLREEVKDAGNALRISGKNVMMCAATTIAGCGSLMTAEFAGIASIGLVLTIGAVACAGIALLMLPASLMLMKTGSGK